MRSFAQSLLLSAVVALAGHGLAAQASSDGPGPCSARLQSQGYTRVELDSSQASTSLYEARRGGQKVKLMVENGSCAVRQTWQDD